MAAATLTAVLDRLLAPVVGGLSVQYAFSFNEAQNLDLLQIVNQGDNSGGTPTVVLNVDFKGNVHNPAVAPTNGTTLGVYFANLPAGSTTAAFFALAFVNPAQLDIVQIINPGGNISYWLDFLGVAHGA
jgi:hypothetical protein